MENTVAQRSGQLSLAVVCSGLHFILFGTVRSDLPAVTASYTQANAFGADQMIRVCVWWWEGGGLWFFSPEETFFFAPNQKHITSHL